MVWVWIIVKRCSFKSGVFSFLSPGATTSPEENTKEQRVAIYKRVLMKVSGETLGGEQKIGFCFSSFNKIAVNIAAVCNQGVAAAVVVGAGNIARGAELAKLGMDRVTADYLGMLATAQNGLALRSSLEAQGLKARVMSALALNPVCEPYIHGRALRHLEKGRVVIFVAGTGNPLCTTDSAASLRAVEIGAQAVLVGKNGTRGVYDRDPNGPEGENAEFLTQVTYDEVIQKNLKVMDQGAMVQLRDHNIVTHVFDMSDPENFMRVVTGEDVGSVVTV